VYVEVMLYFVFLVLLSIISGSARNLYYNLIITVGEIEPDGYMTTAFLVNGQFPGPTIEGNVGDRMIITVTNKMLPSESLTMHWHGIRQYETQWSDGTGAVTNCPLVYGSSFVYNFTLDSVGTFWYHAHTGEIRIKGTFGFFIVRSLELLPLYDDEIHIILSDWYHGSLGDLEAGLMSTKFLWSGNGNSILLNGIGSCKECNLTGSSFIKSTVYSDPRYSSSSSDIHCQGKYQNVLVESGKTYLLRLLNAASLAYFNFAIADHALTLVGADSSPLAPISLHSVDLGPGSRVDAILTGDKPLITGNDTFSYKIQVQTDWRGSDTTPSGLTQGYLTYISPGTTTGSVTNVSQTVPPNESRLWSEWNSLLKAAPDAPPPPPIANRHILLTLQQEYVNRTTGEAYDPPVGLTSGDKITSSMVLAWTLNGKRFMLPSTPYLLTKYLDTQEGVTQSTYDGTTPIRVEHGDVVDITIQNSVAGNGVCEQHPWHLHGHDFWLIGHGSGLFDANTSPETYNLDNPPLLDTAVGYPSSHDYRRGNATHPAAHIPGVWMDPCGWITLRFIADNPGKGPCPMYISVSVSVCVAVGSPSPLLMSLPLSLSLPPLIIGMWLFHCHVGWHTTMGMSVLFDIASERVGPYPSDLSLCGEAVTRVYQQCAVSGGTHNDQNSDALTTTEVAAIATVVTFVVTACVALMIYYLLVGSSRTPYYERNGSVELTGGGDVTTSPIPNHEL
jgi:L-ascorbate oxidase